VKEVQPVLEVNHREPRLRRRGCSGRRRRARGESGHFDARTDEAGGHAWGTDGRSGIEATGPMRVLLLLAPVKPSLYSRKYDFSATSNGFPSGLS
jgi:hypothetical protein